MLDLTSYAAQILNDDDKPIFDEAVRCANAGALRAAFVMIWVACAESLKRRFREAQTRDGKAGKIVGEVEKKEAEEKSVDRFLLEKAKEYGFLSDSAYRVLLSIYEMRCLYGHPYEEAPAPEQVTHAAAMVVGHVLSQPVRLKQGFASTLTKSLLEDPHYLDNEASAVNSFATEILPRIDDSIIPWFLDRYWGELEKRVADASMALFVERGIWFTRTVLELRSSGMLTVDQWHEAVRNHPRILIRVLSEGPLFEQIGDRAQFSLLSSALEEAGERASVLNYLGRLYQVGVLPERLEALFLEEIKKIPSAKLRASGLSTRVCFERIVEDLKSHDWYVQQPMVNLVSANGPEQTAELDEPQQEVLGRNILQVADGLERSARRFLVELGRTSSTWPQPFIRGIALECFVNEVPQLRLKCDELGKVVKILEGLAQPARDEVVEHLGRAIRESNSKGNLVTQQELNKVIVQLETHSWALPIAESLRGRERDLVWRLDDEEE